MDYLVIHTPPGTGDVHLTLLQSYEITGAVVVTTPQPIGLDDMIKSIGMFNKINLLCAGAGHRGEHGLIHPLAASR